MNQCLFFENQALICVLILVRICTLISENRTVVSINKTEKKWVIVQFCAQWYTEQTKKSGNFIASPCVCARLHA